MKENYSAEQKQKYNDREKKNKRRSSKKELKKGEKKRMQLEKQSDEVVNYGLWKSPLECKLKMKELNRTSDKCKHSLQENVLKQTDLDKKLYSFSKIDSNGKRHPLTHMELMSNLLKVLKSV